MSRPASSGKRKRSSPTEEQPDFRRTWKFIYDDGQMSMLSEATYPSQDEETLRRTMRSYLHTHDEPLEKIQLVRMGLMAENYIDEVLRDNVEPPAI
jgi:hypothetical protein